MSDFDHVFVDERFLQRSPYTSTITGGHTVLARSDINKEQHGNFIKVRFNEAIADFYQGIDERDFVYLVFKSVPGFELDIDKFDDKNSFRIASTKVLSTVDATGKECSYIETAIFLNKNAIRAFLKKVEQYLNEYTPQSLKKGQLVPKNNAFVANIEKKKSNQAAYFE